MRSPPKRSLFMSSFIIGGSAAAMLCFMICDFFSNPMSTTLVKAGFLLLALVITGTIIDNRRQGWQTIRFAQRKPPTKTDR